MIVRRTKAELDKMRRANLLVAEVLEELRAAVKPGVTTADLDRIAADRTRKAGARAAFKGYRGFPASLCVSINDEVVHGIPSPRRVIRDGDVVSLDFGAVVEGYYGDGALTVPVGNVSTSVGRLLQVTEQALHRGISAIRVENRVSDIGYAVQSYVESQGFSVVREYVGHGIGTALHEEPQVPNYGQPGRGPRLLPGMVLAIEPMVNAGTHKVRLLSDQWTVVTEDGGASAHFELSVAVTENGPWILSRDQPGDGLHG